MKKLVKSLAYVLFPINQSFWYFAQRTIVILSCSAWNPPATSQMESNGSFDVSFLLFQPEQPIEQAVEWLMIWYNIALTRRHPYYKS